MTEGKSYKHEVFLSFTGADREYKTAIREHLEGFFKQNSDLEECVYDSDLYCNGRFREDYIKALDQSRVYLLILSDNLNNDPNQSGYGFLTEVRKEVSLALDLEARGELNIVVLCMSEFFKFRNSFHDYNDTMGWFFYSHTRGYSQINATFNEDKTLSSATLDALLNGCKRFVLSRKAGTPVPSQAPKIDIADIKFVNETEIVGRGDEVQRAIDAFGRGSQVVVLTGLGGIGKTTLAKEIARKCDELNYLRCPQIVHIQELGGANSGLNALASSVKYDDDFLRALIDGRASESEKAELKIASLSKLPETILLVIDNYNKIRERDVRELLSRLKCRILITTRARIRENAGVEIIPVERLSKGAAYDMFCDVAGKRVDDDGFERLYDKVGGHTITLCIMAKLICVHKMELDELISETSDLEAFNGEVVFEHNEFGDPDTVMGHLKRLFDISSFGEGCKRVLRSLSVLSSGTIRVNTLKQILGLANRNEIEELCSNGWIELQTKQVSGEEIEYIYIHPVVARLMAELLNPDEENVSEMIDYMLDKASSGRTNITYGEAVILDEMLYYACYTIAEQTGKLVKPLWDEFVLINHYLKDGISTRDKALALSAKLDEQSDRDGVIAYGDMAIIEQYPTKTEYLEKYIESLDKNARDYKFVLRSLSIMLPYVVHDTKHREILKKAIIKAIDSAIYLGDDIAMFDLLKDSLVILDDKEIRKKFIDYIKARKRRPDAEIGAIAYMELCIIGECLINPTANEMTKGLSSFYSKIAEHPFLFSIAMWLRHPVSFVKMIKARKTLAEKTDEDDPFARVYSKIENFSVAMLDESKLKVSDFIEAVVELHKISLEAGNTLASARQVVAGAIGTLYLLPQWLVKEETKRIVDNVDMENLSTEDISSLQVAIEINAMFRDPLALEQGREEIKALERIRPMGHVDLYDAWTAHADVCATLGQSGEALSYYLKTYNLMVRRAEDSSRLKDLAFRMLGISYNREGQLRLGSKQGPLTIKDLELLFKRVYDSELSTDEDKISAVSRYASRLVEKIGDFSAGAIEEPLGKALDAFEQQVARMRELSMSAQNLLLTSLDGVLWAVTRSRAIDKEEKGQRLLGYIKAFLGSGSLIKRRARAYVAYREFHLSYYYLKPDCYTLAKKAIAVCLKKGYADLAVSSLYIISYNYSLKTMEDFVDKLVKSKKLKKELLIEAYLTMKYYIAPRVKVEGEERTSGVWTSERFYDLYKQKAGIITTKDLSKRGKRVKIKSTDKFIEKFVLSAISKVRGDLVDRGTFFSESTKKEFYKSVEKKVDQILNSKGTIAGTDETNA